MKKSKISTYFLFVSFFVFGGYSKAQQGKTDDKNSNAALLIEQNSSQYMEFQNYRLFLDSSGFTKFKNKIQFSTNGQEKPSLEDAVGFYNKLSQKYAANKYIKSLKQNMLTLFIRSYSFKTDKEEEYLNFFINESIDKEIFLNYETVFKCVTNMKKNQVKKFVNKQIQLSESILEDMEHRLNEKIPDLFKDHIEEIKIEKEKIKIEHELFREDIRKLKNLLSE